MGVTTADDELHSAPVAVVTAGAWAAPLLADAGIDLPLRVTRETVGYAELPEVADLPTFIEWPADDRPARYALPRTDPDPGPAPEGGGTRVVKVGEHRAGATADPDADDVTQADTEPLRLLAAERFPGAVLTATDTCLYTNTDDEDFVLDRAGPIVIGSPCSGHGFKFAPLIGRILADLATGGHPPVPLERFAWDRPSHRAARP
jgi:sarcosine oxidase